jgi:hypothetical protein
VPDRFQGRDGRLQDVHFEDVHRFAELLLPERKKVLPPCKHIPHEPPVDPKEKVEEEEERRKEMDEPGLPNQ